MNNVLKVWTRRREKQHNSRRAAHACGPAHKPIFFLTSCVALALFSIHQNSWPNSSPSSFFIPSFLISFSLIGPAQRAPPVSCNTFLLLLTYQATCFPDLVSKPTRCFSCESVSLPISSSSLSILTRRESKSHNRTKTESCFFFFLSFCYSLSSLII